MITCSKCGQPIKLACTPMLTGPRVCDDCSLVLDHVSENTNSAEEVLVEE